MSPDFELSATPQEYTGRKFSHSSMSTWRRCRMRYKWSYIDNYAPPSGIGQLRGSAGHAALGEWYGNGQDDDAAIQAAADLYTIAESERNQSLGDDWDLLDMILRRYFDWARANDNFQEIISIEQKFEIKIGGIPVIGYIDGVVRSHNGSIWLLEHKFNKQVSVSHIDLDPQMSLYLLASYSLGIDVKGILYNVIRVAEKGKASVNPVERRMVYRNIEGLQFIEKETYLQLEEMVKFHAEGGIVYRNPTRDCSWDCSFYNVCASLNDNGDAQSVLNSIPIVQREVDKAQEKGEV